MHYEHHSKLSLLKNDTCTSVLYVNHGIHVHVYLLFILVCYYAETTVSFSYQTISQLMFQYTYCVVSNSPPYGGTFPSDPLRVLNVVLVPSSRAKYESSSELESLSGKVDRVDWTVK